MTRGDLVWYRQNLRGGYDYHVDVPAVFLEVSGATRTRAMIEVLLRTGGRKRISVLLRNLRPRGDDEAIRWAR